MYNEGTRAIQKAIKIIMIKPHHIGGEVFILLSSVKILHIRVRVIEKVVGIRQMYEKYK